MISAVHPTSQRGNGSEAVSSGQKLEAGPTLHFGPASKDSNMDTTTTEHIRASGDELGRTVVDVTQALPLLTDAEIDTLGRACANESIRRKIASARELRLFIALGGGQC